MKGLSLKPRINGNRKSRIKTSKFNLLFHHKKIMCPLCSSLLLLSLNAHLLHCNSSIMGTLALDLLSRSALLGICVIHDEMSLALSISNLPYQVLWTLSLLANMGDCRRLMLPLHWKGQLELGKGDILLLLKVLSELAETWRQVTTW